MHVDTVAELIEELNNLTTGMDQTEVLVTDPTNALGLEVWVDADSIKIANSRYDYPTEG
jgi:hypothetical protein